MSHTTNNSRQAAWIAVGSLTSFAFGIVSSMILSRYLPKADYGTYKQVLYVYETLLVIFTLGLPRAYSYFLPRVDIGQAKSLIKKISFIFLLLGSSMSLSLFFCADYIGVLLKNSDLSDALRMFSIVPTMMLPTMGLDGILATFKRAKLMAFYNAVTKIAMLLFVALPVILFNMGYKEAICGFVIASVFSFLLAELLIYYPLRHLSSDRCQISYKEIFTFSLPLLFASMWGIIQISADSFFVSRYFGKEIFAEFANGNMDLPFVGMIVGACATVLSPVFSKLSSKGVNPQTDIMPLWKNTFEKSAMLIYPLVLYFIVFADVLMVILYGKQYEISSSYFIIRSIVSFFNVIAIGPLLINVGYVKSYTMVQIASAICVVVLDYTSIVTIHSPYAISVIQLMCRVGSIIVYLYVISTYFGISLLNLLPLNNIWKIFLLSLFLLPLIKGMTQLLNLSNLYVLVISLLLYSTLFIIISYKIGIDYMKILKSFKR